MHAHGQSQVQLGDSEPPRQSANIEFRRLAVNFQILTDDSEFYVSSRVRKAVNRQANASQSAMDRAVIAGDVNSNWSATQPQQVGLPAASGRRRGRGSTIRNTANEREALCHLGSLCGRVFICEGLERPWLAMAEKFATKFLLGVGRVWQKTAER